MDSPIGGRYSFESVETPSCLSVMAGRDTERSHPHEDDHNQSTEPRQEEQKRGWDPNGRDAIQMERHQPGAGTGGPCPRTVVRWV